MHILRIKKYNLILIYLLNNNNFVFLNKIINLQYIKLIIKF